MAKFSYRRHHTFEEAASLPTPQLKYKPHGATEKMNSPWHIQMLSLARSPVGYDELFQGMRTQG